MGGAYGTLGRELNVEFWRGNRKERNHPNYLGLDVRIILK